MVTEQNASFHQMEQHDIFETEPDQNNIFHEEQCMCCKDKTIRFETVLNQCAVRYKHA